LPVRIGQKIQALPRKARLKRVYCHISVRKAS
jgi:hypothetical protein